MDKKEPISGGKNAPSVDHTGVILATIGDTTWRMFVPTIGFTLLGVWLDSVFELKPWLMFGGIAIGCVGAFLLVKQQIGRLKQRHPARDSESNEHTSTSANKTPNQPQNDKETTL